MGFLKDFIQAPIGQAPSRTRGMGAMGVRPILREPGLDIPGKRNIFEQPSPFGPPLPPTQRPPVVGGPALPPVDPRIIPQRPPSIGGIGGINQPLQPVLQQPQPPQTGGILGPNLEIGPGTGGIGARPDLPKLPRSSLFGGNVPGGGGIDYGPVELGPIERPIPQVPNPLQKMPVPPKRDDFMFIERIAEPRDEFIPRMPNENPIPFVPPVIPQNPISPPVNIGGPPLDTSLIPQREILERPIIPPRRDDFISIGGPGGGRRGPQPSVGDGMTSPSLIGQEINAPMPMPTPVPEPVTTPAPVTPPEPVIQPTVTDPTMSTEPVTTPTDPNMSVDMPVAPIDPVLLQQSASEVMTDPLLRSLYFGTADSPGFYNQLQQAGANLIGSDVPLQQTAGLAPLELLARQQAVAGLGGFEPFLQQNRDLVNQAIQQSRRAEQLQDPYYTQAEDIYKDTMGAYDPSMTQQFYNPFEDAVVQQTIDDVMKAGEQQDIASRAREISAGAFGGSRARLGAEERRRDLGEGLAKALGGIRSQGFQSAQATGLGEFARQQQAKRTGAQGLMGIGVGRGSAASNLGQQLAGFGGQLTGLGRTQEELRRGQRGELSGYGTTGRGIAETGLGRIFEQQMGQQLRPLGVLGQIGSMLPGYQGSRTQIDSQYGMPTDPSAAGLGAAFSAYGAVAPKGSS